MYIFTTDILKFYNFIATVLKQHLRFILSFCISRKQTTLQIHQCGIDFAITIQENHTKCLVSFT